MAMKTDMTGTDGSAFWEAYKALADCYKADLAVARGSVRGSSAVAPAQPAQLRPEEEAPEAPKAKLRSLQRDAVDDDIARLQGHTLQQVLFSRSCDLEKMRGWKCLVFMGGGLLGWQIARNHHRKEQLGREIMAEYADGNSVRFIYTAVLQFSGIPTYFNLST